jgi:hypothetical protein
MTFVANYYMKENCYRIFVKAKVTRLIVICLWLSLFLFFQSNGKSSRKIMQYIKMQQQLFHWPRNAKQLNICSETKVNGIHEMKHKNILYETKRSFAVFYVSRNKRNFAKQFFHFALFRVSRNKKKDTKWKPYLGGIVWWKKPRVENLLTLSL